MQRERPERIVPLLVYPIFQGVLKAANNFLASLYVVLPSFDTVKSSVRAGTKEAYSVDGWIGI
jgi:hypothetical protein